MKYAIQDTGWFIVGMLGVSAITQTFDVKHMALFVAYFFAMHIGIYAGKLLYKRVKH